MAFTEVVNLQKRWSALCAPARVIVLRHDMSSLQFLNPFRFSAVWPAPAQELMYRGADLVEVLRLAVLLSAVGGGLPRRTFDGLRQELLHTYGHQHMLTLNTLERAGGCRVTERHVKQVAEGWRMLRLLCVGCVQGSTCMALLRSGCSPPGDCFAPRVWCSHPDAARKGQAGSQPAGNAMTRCKCRCAEGFRATSLSQPKPHAAVLPPSNPLAPRPTPHAPHTPCPLPPLTRAWGLAGPVGRGHAFSNTLLHHS